MDITNRLQQLAGIINETKIGPKQISKQYILRVLEDNGIDFGQSSGNYLSDNNNEIETESNEWLGVMSDIIGKDAYNEEFTSDDYVKLGNFIRAMENIGVTLKDNNNYVDETKIGPKPLKNPAEKFIDDHYDDSDR